MQPYPPLFFQPTSFREDARSFSLPGTSSLSPAFDKRTVREKAKRLRKEARTAAGEEAPAHLAARFLEAVPWETGAVVGGYWPIGDEADPRPLLFKLAQAGCRCALPVAAKEEPLRFRSWRPGDQLESGLFGVQVPADGAALLCPALLLVPLLAFDRQGCRLGYGGGHYDRTIAGLRAKGRVLAVGLAYAGQELPRVPSTAADQALDWVVTEREAILIKAE